MEALDRTVLDTVRGWLADGQPCHLATVVRTWGSAPRQAGAMLAIRDADGALVGSVSGGCVEDDLVERNRQDEFGALPQVVRYGVSQEDAGRFGLPCGGTLELVIEPLREAGWLARILALLGSGQRATRELDLASGRSRVGPSERGAALSPASVRDGRLVAVYGNHWRLLVIGANQTGAALADIAQALGFEVSVCDPREEVRAAWPAELPPILGEMPDDQVLAMRPDAQTAIVALTHDPKLDDLALIEALRTEAFYVGALGSQRNNARRRERLALFDLDAAQIDRLHGPVGLPIGSRTPAEIAVAVAAHLIQQRAARS